MPASPNNSSRMLVANMMPGTLVELRKKTGLARSTVARAVEAMHAANASRAPGVLACHISKWADSAVGANSPYLAVYSLGHGKDVPCPVVKRASGGDCAGRARMRALEEADRAAQRKDPWLWCMFDTSVVL